MTKLVRMTISLGSGSGERQRPVNSVALGFYLFFFSSCSASKPECSWNSDKKPVKAPSQGETNGG
jgi:hypothetical protein